MSSSKNSEPTSSSVPSLNKKDFAVVELEGKNLLVKVAATEGKSYIGSTQRMSRRSDGTYETRKKITFRRKDVLVNLGPSPKNGKVYGVTVEPLRERVETNTCGEILVFAKLDSKELSRVKTALVKSYKFLDKKGLLKVQPALEIRPPSGKYSGTYQVFPKATSDLLVLYPNFETMDDDYLRYAILHEYGHALWFRCLSDRSIASWIQLYAKHTALNACDEDDLSSMLEEIVSAGSIKDFLRSADDEETKLQVKAILRHIKNLHSITQKHLDKLLRLNEDISSYWPSFVEFSEKNFIISEYAATEVEEFFAEAFSFALTGKKLPKDVKKLLDKSLNRLDVREHIAPSKKERSDE